MSSQAIKQARRICSEIPWRERVALLEHLAGEKIADIIRDRTLLSGHQSRCFEELLEQRRKGVPLQLITGTAMFMDFAVKIEPGVFIPRPETEELCQHIFAELAREPETILELGTGSGIIAIALARRYPGARITATDLSPAALSLATRNARDLGVEKRINFKQGDLFNFQGADELRGSVDLLLSNPPYVPTSHIEGLQPEVKDYDPALALDGGEDGFRMVRRILDDAPSYLAPEGLAALEIDPTLDAPLEEYRSKSDLWMKTGVDFAGNLRFLFVRVL